MLASQKQEAIREAFKDWVFHDPGRRQDLCAKYNELSIPPDRGSMTVPHKIPRHDAGHCYSDRTSLTQWRISFRG